MLQVTKRRQAGAKIVQRKHAAEFLERLNKTVCLRVVGHSCRFGNLETDLGRFQATGLEFLDYKRQKLVIAEA